MGLLVGMAGAVHGAPRVKGEVSTGELDAVLEGIYRNAERAVGEGDREVADFWMARYMGLTVFNQKTERGHMDLLPLFEKREDLVPTAFVSGKYSEEFLQFFVQGPAMLWGGVDELVNEKDRAFAL